jgi:hypothetical protein
MKMLYVQHGEKEIPRGMRGKVGNEMHYCRQTIHKVENSLVNDKSSPSGSLGHDRCSHQTSFIGIYANNWYSSCP